MSAKDSSRSLRMIAARCVSTVLTLIPSDVATSLLLFPSARSCTVSRSRGVSPSVWSVPGPVVPTEIACEDHFGNVGGEVMLVLRERFDGRDEVLGDVALENVTARPGVKDCVDELFVFFAGEDQQLGSRRDFPDLPCGVETVQLRIRSFGDGGAASCWLANFSSMAVPREVPAQYTDFPRTARHAERFTFRPWRRLAYWAQMIRWRSLPKQNALTAGCVSSSCQDQRRSHGNHRI